MRYRITVRADNIELRGYIDDVEGRGVLTELADAVKPLGAMVIASPAPVGFYPWDYSEQSVDEVLRELEAEDG